MSTITHPTEPHIPAHALPGQEAAVPPQHRHIGASSAVWPWPSANGW